MVSGVRPPSHTAVATSVGCDQSVKRSPPAARHCPVIPAAASEARNTTAGAASSGVPRPPRRISSGTGAPRSTRSVSSPRPGIVATMRVRAVGMTALTVTPIRSHSTAHVRTRPTIPALAAE
jgi:hypothetical protein